MNYKYGSVSQKELFEKATSIKNCHYIIIKYLIMITICETPLAPPPHNHSKMIVSIQTKVTPDQTWNDAKEEMFKKIPDNATGEEMELIGSSYKIHKGDKVITITLEPTSDFLYNILSKLL